LQRRTRRTKKKKNLTQGFRSGSHQSLQPCPIIPIHKPLKHFVDEKEDEDVPEPKRGRDIDPQRERERGRERCVYWYADTAT